MPLFMFPFNPQVSVFLVDALKGLMGLLKGLMSKALEGLINKALRRFAFPLGLLAFLGLQCVFPAIGSLLGVSCKRRSAANLTR